MSKPIRHKRGGGKLLVLLLAAVTLAILAWYVNNNFSLGELADEEIRLRDFIEANPVRSFLVGFGIYIVAALVPGTGGKGIVYGWLFGFWQAVTIVTIGLTGSAMLIFFLSRYLLQEYIERRYTNFVTVMNSHIEKEGAFYLLMLRMAHAPYSIVNPVSGASRVSTWTFFWTTSIGLLPANAIWVYVGIRLPSLHELADAGAEAFLDLPLFMMLVAVAVLPWLIRALIKRFGVATSEVTPDEFEIKQSQQEDP